jgi:hypothetical protein
VQLDALIRQLLLDRACHGCSSSMSEIIRARRDPHRNAPVSPIAPPVASKAAPGALLAAKVRRRGASFREAAAVAAQLNAH